MKFSPAVSPHKIERIDGSETETVQLGDLLCGELFVFVESQDRLQMCLGSYGGSSTSFSYSNNTSFDLDSDKQVYRVKAHTTFEVIK